MGQSVATRCLTLAALAHVTVERVAIPLFTAGHRDRSMRLDPMRLRHAEGRAGCTHTQNLAATCAPTTHANLAPGLASEVGSRVLRSKPQLKE